MSWQRSTTPATRGCRSPSTVAATEIAGHAVSDDGVMVDLRPMKEIQIDSQRRVARARRASRGAETRCRDAGVRAGGNRWAHVHDRVSQASPSAPDPAGSSESFGLAADNLISAEVVLADGSLVTASDSENQDLFWGLRGGSGNFGIVTEFEFQLHPVGPMMLAGMLVHPGPRAGEVLRFFREFMAGRARRGRRGPRAAHGSAAGLRTRGGARKARRGHDRLLRRRPQ